MADLLDVKTIVCTHTHTHNMFFLLLLCALWVHEWSVDRHGYREGHSCMDMISICLVIMKFIVLLIMLEIHLTMIRGRETDNILVMLSKDMKRWRHSCCIGRKIRCVNTSCTIIIWWWNFIIKCIKYLSRRYIFKRDFKGD